MCYLAIPHPICGAIGGVDESMSFNLLKKYWNYFNKQYWKSKQK